MLQLHLPLHLARKNKKYDEIGAVLIASFVVGAGANAAISITPFLPYTILFQAS